MYETMKFEPDDTFTQKVVLGALGPIAFVQINGDGFTIICEDPDQCDQFAEVLLEAGRDLRASLVDHAETFESELNALRDAS